MQLSPGVLARDQSYYFGPIGGSVGQYVSLISPGVLGFQSLDLSLYALKSGGLGQFAAESTSSDQLRSVMSNPTGTGSLVFGTGPTIDALTLTGNLNSSGNIRTSTFAGVGFYTGSPGTDVAALLNAGGSPSRSGVYLERTGVIRWSSGGVVAGFIGTNSAGLESPSAAVLKVNNGSSGFGALDIGSPNVNTPGLTVRTVASQGNTPSIQVLATDGATNLFSFLPGNTPTLEINGVSGGIPILRYARGGTAYWSAYTNANNEYAIQSTAHPYHGLILNSSGTATFTSNLTASGSGTFTAPNVTTPALTLNSVTSQTAATAVINGTGSGRFVTFSRPGFSSFIAANNDLVNFRSLWIGSNPGEVPSGSVIATNGQFWITNASGGLRGLFDVAASAGAGLGDAATGDMVFRTETVGGSVRFGVGAASSFLVANASGLTASGTVTVRQTGGTAGVNEEQTWHDGTHSYHENLVAGGSIYLGREVFITRGGGGAGGIGTVVAPRFSVSMGGGNIKWRMLGDSPVCLFSADTPIAWVTGNTVGGESSGTTAIRPASPGVLAVNDGGGAIICGSPNVTTAGHTIHTLTNQQTPALRVRNPGNTADTVAIFPQRIDLVTSKYDDSECFRMWTDDGNWIGFATASLRINPACSTGLGEICFFTDAGFRLQSRSKAGADYCEIEFGSSGMIMNGVLTIPLSRLPISDPGVPGRVWRDGTTLKISI